MTNFFSWIANGLMLEAMSAHKFFAYFVAILMIIAGCYCLVKIILLIVKKVQKREDSGYYKKSKRGGEWQKL